MVTGINKATNRRTLSKRPMIPGLPPTGYNKIRRLPKGKGQQPHLQQGCRARRKEVYKGVTEVIAGLPMKQQRHLQKLSVEQERMEQQKQIQDFREDRQRILSLVIRAITCQRGQQGELTNSDAVTYAAVNQLSLFQILA